GKTLLSFCSQGSKGKTIFYSNRYNLSVVFLKRLNFAPHGPHLFRPPAGEGERHKQEHSVLFALQVAEFEILHLVGLQGEVRSLLPYLNTHRSSSFAV